MPVAIARALRSVRMGAPAMGVRVAGAGYREAVRRERGPAIAGVEAGSAGIPNAGIPNAGIPSASTRPVGIFDGAATKRGAAFGGAENARPSLTFKSRVNT
jgi:hypothetical protein